MHIAILDDEETYHKIIKDILVELDSNIEVSSFTDEKVLLQDTTIFDLLLLDIEMPNINGIKFAQRYIEYFPYVMFVTSHEECALDAFYPNVCGYILKKQIHKTLGKKIEDFQKCYYKVIYLHTSLGDTPFKLNAILYFVICGADIQLKLNQNQITLQETSLKKIKEKSNYSSFILVNRTHLVNTKHIVKLLKVHHEIVMSDESHIEVSRRNWTNVMHEYLKGFTS